MTTTPQPPASAIPDWPDFSASARRVLLELLLHGPGSRAGVAERLDLSRTSLTRVSRELVESGIVATGDLLASASRGRPAEELHLRPESAYFVGIKVTAERIYGVVTDITAKIVDQFESALGSTGVDDVVAQIVGIVDHFRTPFTPVAAGVCLAADVDRSQGVGLVTASPLLGWVDPVPLSQVLEQALGIPVTVSNDVHALTAAHHWFGGGIGRSSMVVYGIGAGIGSGLVFNDEIVEGAHGRSGRIGHLRLRLNPGRACSNGHTDCAHSYVSMPAIVANAGDSVGSQYEQVLGAARLGDPLAVDAFRRASFALGAVVAESVNTADPELVALMGEGLDMLDLAPDEFESGLEEFLEAVPRESVTIERPEFRFALYARGAAVVAIRGLLS